MRRLTADQKATIDSALKLYVAHIQELVDHEYGDSNTQRNVQSLLDRALDAQEAFKNV